MPPKTSGETRYSRRNVVVRERVNRILKMLAAKGDMRADVTFANKCFEIVEKNPTHRWLKRKSDASASVRRFAWRGQDWYFHLLDTAELACMEFEYEFKQDQAERKMASVGNPVPAPIWFEKAGCAGSFLKMSDANQVVFDHTDPVDPEVDAIAKCSAILGKLNTLTAALRVIDYVAVRMREDAEYKK